MTFHTDKDDTEQNQTGEALIESEERLRLALSVAEMGTWRWDAVNDVDTRDAVLNKMLGLEAVASTQPNNDFLERIHPDDRPAAVAELERSIRENDMCKAVFRVVRPDGTIRWFQDQSRSFFDDKGEHILSTGVVRDITDFKEMEESRNRAMEELENLKNKLEEENIYLRSEIDEVRFSSKIIGKSNALLYVLSRLNEVAETDSTVLIQGETGVGKELMARAVHESGERSQKPFIKVNCAALPQNLVESELFGHEKGAFTGAERLRKGRFEVADGGTIFLDEVSELPPGVQAKLLNVLQEGEFERVGGNKTLKTDVRIITASNRNLNEEVLEGRFRADLYYRLNVFPLTVPPLRKRKTDIPLLIEYFVPQIASRIGKHIDQIPSRVMEQLMEYNWPGNVRELRNVLERAVITSRSSVLQMPAEFQSKSPDEPPDAPQEWNSLEEVERRYIIKVLEKTEGRIEGPRGAAELLQLKPSTLRHRINKLGIKRKRT